MYSTFQVINEYGESVTYEQIEPGNREILDGQAIGHINGLQSDVYALGLQGIYQYLKKS